MRGLVASGAMRRVEKSGMGGLQVVFAQSRRTGGWPLSPGRQLRVENCRIPSWNGRTPLLILIGAGAPSSNWCHRVAAPISEGTTVAHRVARGHLKP